MATITRDMIDEAVHNVKQGMTVDEAVKEIADDYGLGPIESDRLWDAVKTKADSLGLSASIASTRLAVRDAGEEREALSEMAAGMMAEGKDPLTNSGFQKRLRKLAEEIGASVAETYKTIRGDARGRQHDMSSKLSAICDRELQRVGLAKKPDIDYDREALEGAVRWVREKIRSGVDEGAAIEAAAKRFQVSDQAIADAL